MIRHRSILRWLAVVLPLPVFALTFGHFGEVSATGPSLPTMARTAVMPSAAHTGPPLQDPPELVSRNGVLRARIVVERRKVLVGDRILFADTYNGRYMPPTLRLRPGDQLDLTMANRTSEGTNVHVHGLHVSPRSPGDNIFITIKPGQTYHYAYRLPRNITPGTYWYHSHENMRSAPQVAGGESGIIIVDGLRDYLRPSLRHITEHVIALKDDQVQGNAIKTEGLTVGASTNRTVNGQQDPVIRIRPGETQLWRLANIGANIYYNLHLPGSKFYVIAQDGYPVKRVYAADSLVIPAASRFDVLVQGGPAGQAPLQTLAYNTGPAGNQFPQVNLATVVSQGAPTPAASIPVGFAPNEDLSHATITTRQSMTYTENAAGTEFYINGRQFAPNRVDFTSTLNTVEEWTVFNKTNEQHSFHLHTDHFQVMSVNGRPVPRGHAWYETFNVPVQGNIVIRVHFTEYVGRTVLHCHLLNHEDKGMMAVLDIVPAQPGSPRQAVGKHRVP
ncbi:multicopper oxidase family protein [Streptantibioticus ferralitis]|uniref:Multicopper oxidase family protein n=1 Tax=Streptantibioticus ferralitis TaxID=236510 RepID=A0ABT5Z8R4_9ACTN|nr:multicopper oxidase family protein [Streptantibioticus ferralitis]MDF2260113.1 multicopper oxidase family protein [Streptantibioticus ferralitis]